MSINKNQIEQIAIDGYDLDFSRVIESAFENYKKIFGIAGLGFMIYAVLIFVILAGLLGSFYGFANFTETMTGFAKSTETATSVSILFGGAIFAGIFSPVNAGFLKMCKNASSNQPYSLNTLFDYYNATYFKDLFLATALVSMIGSGFDFGFKALGNEFVGSILSLVLSFLTILSVPLIIFNNFNFADAITTSIRLVMKKPFIILILLIIAVLFVVIGIFGLCIGIFFTAPFWYSMNYILYEEIIPESENSILDEIGTKQE